MATASRKKLLSVNSAPGVKVADITKYHHITANYGQQLKTPTALSVGRGSDLEVLVVFLSSANLPCGSSLTGHSWITWVSDPVVGLGLWRRWHEKPRESPA